MFHYTFRRSKVRQRKTNDLRLLLIRSLLTVQVGYYCVWDLMSPTVKNGAQ